MASGTVPTARLGSGTASSSTFLRGDSTFQTVNTDLVSDTSPQLGGDLDTNDFEILLDDNHAVKFGNDVDLTVLHSGSTGVINNVTGDLHIKTTGSGDDIVLISNDDIELQPQAGEAGIKVIGNGAIELYHDNEKMFQTNQDGATFFDSDNNFNLYFTCNGTTRGYLFVDATNGGKMSFYDNQNHPMLEATKNGAVDLYYDNTKTIETTSGGAQILNGTGDAQLNIRGGSSDGRATLQFISDDSNANNDNFRLRNDANNDFYLQNYSSGSWETNIKAVGDGVVELYYDNSKTFETKSIGAIVTNPTGAGNRVFDITNPSNDYAFISLNDQNTTNNGTVRIGALANEMIFYGGGNFSQKIDSNGHFLPATNNTFDLGSSSLRWRNVYTNDLNLSNKGSQNDVDGTWGDYQIQEGESDLFLINKRSGKKFKFMLQEVL